MRLRITKFCALILGFIALVAACGDDDDGARTKATASPTSAARLRVVATTTQIADMARAIAGPSATGVDVTSLVGANQDPHDFEATPDQLRALSDARLVLRHGLNFDRFADKPLSSVDKERVVTVTEGVRRIGDDPHVWFDVANAKVMAANIGDALARADERNADAYRANAAAYLKELDRLDAFVRSETDRVPRQCRKLVTDHQALTHYAAAYGFEIVATAVPGASTGAEPSARDIATVVERIKAARVPAIFAQASENPALMERIAREADVRVVTGIYADSLGPPGSDGDTYVKMMEANTRKIVGALEGCAR